jgi:hypothetical protein
LNKLGELKSPISEGSKIRRPKMAIGQLNRIHYFQIRQFVPRVSDFSQIVHFFFRHRMLHNNSTLITLEPQPIQKGPDTKYDPNNSLYLPPINLEPIKNISYNQSGVVGVNYPTPKIHPVIDEKLDDSIDKKRKRFDLFFDVKQYHPPTKTVKPDDEVQKNCGPWTTEEDNLLLRGMQKYGTQWTRIGKEFVLTRSRSSIAQRGRCLYQSKQKFTPEVVQEKNGPIVWHLEMGQ